MNFFHRSPPAAPPVGPPSLVRLARPEDVETVSEVIAASITTLCRADHHDDPQRYRPWVASKSPHAVEMILSDPAQRLFVFGQDRILAVGGTDWRHQPDEQARISMLFVAPEARGQGHSSALLAAMESDLLAMGRREARLTATNTALAFYRARGWQTDDRAGGGFLLGHPLRKKLG